MGYLGGKDPRQIGTITSSKKTMLLFSTMFLILSKFLEYCASNPILFLNVTGNTAVSSQEASSEFLGRSSTVINTT